MYINQSLSYLEQCVVALSRRNAGHVPYRQSKLTNVLKVKRSATATEHTRPAVPPARETSLSGKGRNIEESKSGGGARVRTRCTAVGGQARRRKYVASNFPVIRGSSGSLGGQVFFSFAVGQWPSTYWDIRVR